MHNAEFSEKQLDNIAVLQKMYYGYIEEVADIKQDKEFNNKLTELVLKSGLINFQSTKYALLINEKISLRAPAGEKMDTLILKLR